MCRVQYQAQATRMKEAVPAFREHMERTFQPHEMGAMGAPDGRLGTHTWAVLPASESEISPQPL